MTRVNSDKPQETPLTRQNTVIGGKYRLGEIIGSGGVASVYRATHTWTGREVAVKVLNRDLPHFDQLRTSFLKEARATVRLDHPNVVDVLDMGEDNWDTVFLVMELLHGPTLREVLLEHGQLTARDTLTILSPLIDALDKAHALGIVHRDFKPENVILSLDAQGRVTPKLLDFGVAEVIQDVRARAFRGASEVIVGTPQYMSPEQARDQRERIGPHTDVWGVGVVLYECLAGRSPFEAETSEEVLRAVCEQPVDFSSIPEEFVSLLQDVLVRSTDERMQSLTELTQRLYEMGVSERPPSQLPPPSVAQLPTPSDAARMVQDSHIQRTLYGVGPQDALPPPAPLPRTQVDSELREVPLRSDRKFVATGLAIALATVVAAWWSLREPDTPVSSVVSETPAPIEDKRPTPSPERDLANAVPSQSPSAKALPAQDADAIDGDGTADATSAPAEATESGPVREDPDPDLATLELAVPDAAVEPPPVVEPVADTTDSVRKRRRSRRSRPIPDDTPSSRSYEKPPGLVTEW